MPIVVRINGDRRELPAPLALSALLDDLKIDWRTVAVERNRQVVRRAVLDRTTIEDGDEIEVVAFVGGG